MTRDEAPITGLTLTVQFAPSLPLLDPLRLAEAYVPFREEFPIFEQVPPAGPMPLNPASPIPAMMLDKPRTRLSTTDRHFSILFQEDRFTFIWSRQSALSQPSEYPGFTSVRERAERCWTHLRDVLFRDQPITPQPSVGEIAYTDGFDLERTGRLFNVFTCINPKFDAEVRGLSATWTEPGLGSGMIQTSIVAPVQIGAVGAVQMQVTSRFEMPGGWDALESRFTAAHALALASFDRLIDPAFRPI